MAADTQLPPPSPDWSAALAAARSRAAPPPPPDFLEHSPIARQPPSTPFSDALQAAAAMVGGRADIVFDLDDTLLVTDYTAREAWHPDPFAGEPTVSAWDFRRMRPSWWLTLRNGWRLPARHRYCPRTYPFLAEAVVTAQWRPGTFGLLAGLQAAGHTLYLATASARVRWAYIVERFPFVSAYFPPERVACAEDLLAATASLNFPAEAYFLKGPELLKAALNQTQLDLLIDDSPRAAALYRERNLYDRFIHAEAKDPHGPALVPLLTLLAARLDSAAEQPSPAPPPLNGRDCLRFEDPFYRPFLNNPDAGEVLRAALSLPGR